MADNLVISFSESSSAEKSKSAIKLADKLKELSSIDSVNVSREKDDAQDPGTIISIVLGAPAIVIAVKAIAAWAVRNNQSDVTFETKDRKVIFRNLKSENVPDAIKALEKIIK